MILDTLAASTRKRVEKAKEKIPLSQMKDMALAICDREERPGRFPFEEALKTPGISFICEVKKASPSKGLIAPDFPYMEIFREYENAGAAAISVLTEPEYFLGSNVYLTDIKKEASVPLLRKDFTVDPYQIYEAKVLGASAVLLICALLDTRTLCSYIKLCDSLSLSALVEAHDDEEITSALEAGARIIGVNNRNLKTFQVDFTNSIRLRNQVPPSVLFVAESGVKSENDIRLLHEAGVNAVLIGETLMRSPDKKAILTRWKNICRHHIKICGLTRPEDIEAVNEYLPDYIGFVFAPSKRQVTKEQALQLKKQLSPNIQAVGVFVNSPLEDIISIIEAGIIDFIQLHGDEDAAYAKALRKQTSLPIIRAVRVKSSEDILSADAYPADYLLFDTYSSDQYGGGGRTFDWSLIPAVKKPYFLAGGLNASNVEAALKTPAFCLDVSSAVETDGKKDPEKLKEIIQTVRRI